MGNHWHDKKDVFEILRDPNHRIVLPANMYNVDDEKLGIKVFKTSDNIPFAAMNLLGTVFMKGNNRDPFAASARLLPTLDKQIKIRFLDIHAETSSEKQCFGFVLAGKCTAVYGTHWHVPTADERIILEHTGFITDIGLTGGRDSVIGMDKEAAIKRMLQKKRFPLHPAKKDLVACYIVVDVDIETGRCLSITRGRYDCSEA